jgi:hypothetical protein
VLAAWPVYCAAAFIPENQRQIPTVTIHVAPVGNDAGDGSEARPFQSLTRAQRAVRSANNNADVIVELADGIYRLSEPLQFRAVDGGQAGTRVMWKAAANASPVIAGSVRVTDGSLRRGAPHLRRRYSQGRRQPAGLGTQADSRNWPRSSSRATRSHSMPRA